MASSKLVWTSDPEEAKRLRDAGKLETPVDIDAAKQTIRVALDKKRRADGEIEIQGDHAARVKAELEKLGYRVK